MCVFTLLLQVCDIISPRNHTTAPLPSTHTESCFIYIPAAAELSSLIDSHKSWHTASSTSLHIWWSGVHSGWVFSFLTLGDFFFSIFVCSLHCLNAHGLYEIWARLRFSSAGLTGWYCHRVAKGGKRHFNLQAPRVSVSVFMGVCVCVQLLQRWVVSEVQPADTEVCAFSKCFF